jgi:hypothetical protein
MTTQQTYQSYQQQYSNTVSGMLCLKIKNEIEVR